MTISFLTLLNPRAAKQIAASYLQHPQANENNMVLISPPPVVVVTDRDPEPVKATGTRGTGTEAARNDHVHPLKIATNGGLEFITGDSLRATSSGGGLNQAQVDARVAAGITDDAILDLGEASRTSADRGKVLGVSKTNENAVALLILTRQYGCRLLQRPLSL